MILDEYLEITPCGKSCAYYKKLGYDVHKGIPIKVKIEDAIKFISEDSHFFKWIKLSGWKELNNIK